MQWDRRFLVLALAYAVAGMALGNWMGASHDHVQKVTHAHILLVGFVVSLAYALIHKLWLHQASAVLCRVQFVAHQAGAAAMAIGLYLMFGNLVPEERIGPVLGMGSAAVLVGAVLMLVMVLRSPTRR
jgi:hypothetical protein